MRHKCRFAENAAWVYMGIGLASGGAIAEVVRDGTIGPNTSVQPVGPNFEIVESMGEVRGSNLFHSFDKLSIGLNESATFSGAQSISNIISRVTGADVSQIDGTLRSTIPGAALYLMNPKGIVFGPGAELDLQGAFHAGATSALEFSNGDVLSASSNTTPILSLTTPEQFGFLGGAANVDLRGSFLNNVGGITASGRSVSLHDGATVMSRTIDSTDAGAIAITASEKISLSGGNEQGWGSSVQSLSMGDGRGAAISVRAPVIELSDGSGIGAIAIGNGPGGSTSIVASHRLTLSGHDGSGWGATLQASSGGVGDAGSLHIDAPIVEMRDGAYLSTSTLGPGAGGELSVVALDQLVLSGVNDSGWGAAIQAMTSGDGHAGDVRITAGRVGLHDGAIITTNSLDSGDGGSVRIAAREGVRLSGGDANGRPAEIQAGAYGDGAGGAIHLSAEVIELRDGAFMESNTLGLGMGGELRLDARNNISLSGRDAEGWSARLEAGTAVSGNGGKVILTAPIVDLMDGSVLSTGTAGTGPGGAISISASLRLTLSGTGYPGNGTRLEATTEHDGAAGEIRVDAGIVELRDGASLTTNTSAAGIGGIISVTASDRIVTSGTDDLGEGVALLAVATASGMGGILQLSAPVISLSNGTRVASSSVSLGDAGAVNIAASDALHLTGNSRIESQSRMAAGGNVSIHAGRLIYLNDSEITTNVFNGTGSGGNISIDPQLVVLDNSRISAKADAGQGGEIRIRADHILASSDSVIDASAGPAGIDGRVDIAAPETNLAGELSRPQPAFVDASALLRPSCNLRAVQDHPSGLRVAQRRGLPVSPDDLLLAFDDPPLPITLNDSNGPAPDQDDLALTSAHWRQAAEDAASRGDGEAASSAFQKLTQIQHVQGEYAESMHSLHNDLAQALRDNDAARIAAALGGLGNAYLAFAQYDAAAAMLEESAALTQDHPDSKLAAVLLNNLGNVHTVKRNHSAALEAYAQSARRARLANQPDLETKALANGARSALASDQSDVAEALLKEARTSLQAAAQSRDKAENLIHLALSAQRLAQSVTADRAEALRAQAYRDLRAAFLLSQELGDKKLLSYALGHLGALYQQAHRMEEALYLTRFAQQMAEQSESTEASYRWYRQEGQILWTKQEGDAALAAYRRAVEILESTRQETLAQYGDASVRFRQLVAPVYLEFADVLLQRSAHVADPTPLLMEARLTSEQLKAAELRDYFSDECVAELEAKATRLEAVSARAAVVYPIVLAERLELLVSLSSGLQRFVVPVDGALLTQTVQQFRELLEMRDPWRYLPLAKQLYDWLVRPYRDALREENIETLVFVPDGPLRTVPVAALHDGDTFLVNDFGVAVTPGLALINPQPLTPSRARVVLAGLSEPVLEFPALPHVAVELQALHATLGGRVLMNGEFTEKQLQRALDQDVTILHIASHAEFSGTADGSFILTYDGRLPFDRFARALAVTRYRDAPLELLVLSACQTAAGDERAALGLAGIGVRAGARSALGSLWAISDDATSELMNAFYRQLQQPHTSKAQALRAAQQTLLGTRRFSHPYYWSAFLLINNWL